MSMLDAAASGLPIIVNDTICAPERTESNGVTYRLNDFDDLIRKLLSLRDAETRKLMGAAGAAKMKRRYSWESLAERRLKDYQTALAWTPNGVGSSGI
jgi:glycosyltransferase involved in cell wall biosynthesis